MIQSQLFRIENAKRPLAVLTLLVLLAALAALGQPRDARAQSPPEDVVLVSNVDQTAGDELTTETGRSSYAQSFTTGDHPDGYFLSSVDLGLSLAEGAEVKVELWRSHNSSHTPSVAIPRYYLMTLSGPSSVDDDTSTLELFSTNDVVLLPNWTYWIVVTRKGGDDEGLTLASTSTQDAIDPGGMSGFELRESVLLVDARLSELYAGDPTTGLLKEMELDPRIKIKLRGSEATRPPGPYATNRNLNPWAAAAETGDSITRYANSFTPDHHSFLLTPGANVSVNSFELTSVSLSVAAEEGVSPRVAIHLDDDGRPSANPIPNGTLTSPSALSRDLSAPGRAEFAASPALNLSKGTKYWVVIEANPGSGRLSIGTAADDELGRKLSEGTWHFGYKMKSWAGSSWIDDGQGRAFRISLNGTTDVEQGRLYVNSPQVGMGVTAYIEDATNQLISRVQDESWQWQRGDSKDGQFTDIPAEEGGTSGVYTPSASDLGKWLKATVTYNDGFAPGRSASAVAYHPVQSQPVVSNAGSQFPNVLDGYHLGTDLVNIAQAFTTGDKSSGYIFGGLRVGLDVDTNENELSWALHPDDGGHPAETPLFASVAVPPEGLDRDVKTLEELLHPGHRLEPGTKYWAVLTALSPGQARVQFEEATYAVDEGGEVEVTLSLTEEHDEALTVPILASGLGGADIDDYDGVPDSVTFEPGETSVSFRIGATDDDEAEDGERLHLSLGELPKGSHPGGPAQTIVYINEAGQAPAQGPTLRFGAQTYRVVEGETVEVTVVLSQPLANDLVVPIVATGQGGARPSDFTVSSSITVGAGETEQRFTFAAILDEGAELYEGFESVSLRFGELGGAVSAASRHAVQTTVIITDAFEAYFYEPALGVSAVNEWGDRRILYGPSGELDQGSEPGWSFDYMTLAKADSRSTEWIPFSRAIETHGKTVLRMSVLTYPQVTATFGQAEYEVAEGGSVEVTVSLSEDPQRSVTIPLSATGQDEADATDFEVPESITFDAGEQSKTVTISALQDEIDDDDETILLGFGATLPDGVTAGSPDRATVSIIDDDHPPVTVRFEQSAYEVDEGGSVVVAVTLSAAPEREVEIPLTGSPQGETDSGDFSGVPASLTFNADQTSRTFTFSATPDSIDDDGDSVLLGFGATLPDGVTAGSPDRATVSIIDDDHPPVTVRFEQSAYEVDEGGSVVVAVTLSAAPEREVEIPLTGSPQGETDSGDFSGVPASLTFNADQTSRTFTFSATDDLLDDDGDSVLLGFGATLPDGVTAGSPDRATVSITDDDHPPVTVRFEQSAYAVDEGGSVVVAVTLSAAPEREVEIPLTGSPQGETDSNDFSGVPASLTFNADQTSRTFTFSATDDLLDDDGDSVLLGFGATLPDGVTAGSPDRATVSITDDDHPPVTVRFEQSAYEVDEGGSVVVAVTLSAAPEREVEIPLTGSPQGETDSGDFSGVPASLTFNADQTSRTFTFSATDDLLDDDGDSVLLGFGSTLPDGVTAGSPDQATISITDDDRPDSLTVRFQTANYSIIEGDSRTITVLLDDDPERSVVIPIRAEHEGGANPSDYSDLPASLTFNSGQTSRSFQLRAVEDQLIESGEQLRLRFDQLPPDVSAGDPAVALATLHDRTQGQNLPSPPTIHFAQASYTVAEGATLQITVTLSKAPGSEVEITLTGSPQGETTAADFSIPTSLTFGPAETSKTLTFAATPDSIDDDGDSVLLSFSNLPAGITTTPGSPDQATVSIIDDDHPPVTVRFEQSAYEVDEGGSVVVAVTLSAAPEREVEIPLTGSPQGETDSGDFSGVPASLTFNADQTSRTFTFSATDDLLDDDGDSVLLTFGATLPDGVTAGSPDRATVSIIDDDHPPVTVRFEQSAYEVDEGGSVVVAVTLSAAPEREVEIPLTGSPQGETDSGDFSGVPASLTFNADQTSRTFTFSATDDLLDDDGDSVLLGFGATLPDGVTAGSPDRATVSIIDDDHPPVTVRFEQSAYEVDEGGSVVVAVTLSAAPEREVEIPLTGSPQGETDSGDFSGVPASLTFNADQTSRTFTFSATDDLLDDDGDSVLLTFGATLPDGVTAGSPDRATVSIIDDDHPPVTVRFEQSAYEVDEGGSVVVAVTLSAAPEREVEIPLTGSPQGETDSGDFSGVPASLTFNADQTSRTFTFSANDDLLNDDGDSVLLGFGSTLPDGVTAGSPDRATVSIIDDDHPPVTVRFEQSAYEVDEGGSVVVAVTLSAAPEREVEIPLTGSPQGETDSGDFSGVPASLTFNADQTSRTFTFSATPDSIDDDGDSVLLGFGATLPDGVTAGSPDRATVSIIDDDHPPVTVRFEQSAYEVDEGGSVVVAVTLSAAPEREVEIPLTGSPQGETDSGDFSGVPASLTFNADQTSRTFTFSATDDLLDDDGDSVLLTFGATLPDGVTAGSPDRATVSIIDDDHPPVTVRFEQSAYEVDEGGSVVVAVTLSAAPEREVEIPLTGSPQGETDSGDFSGVPASLTFNADQTSRTFTFSATDDLLDDDGDSVLLGFGSTLPDGVTAGSPDQATVSITDDDRPDSLTVRFQTANYSIIEGDSRTITVLLDDDPERSVVIPIRAEHEGGANPSDYSDLPASLTFNSGQTSRSFQLRAVEDQLIESGEQLRLRFDQLPPDVSAGDPAVALATLHDRTQGQNLPSPPTIHFAQASYTVAEGATLQITVTLSKAPGSEVEITLTGSPQGETTAADFSIPTSLTFGPAETSKTLTFAATPDSIDDDGDSVLLSFSNLPAGITTTPGSPDQATVSIIDDDHPPVTVRFEQSAYEVDEGGSVVVAVTLSAAPEREVEIPLTGSPQGETDSGDFSGVPASLTFNADQTSRTFTFSATDDLLDDDGDSVLLTFGATLPDGVTAGSPDRATVSIIDDDHPPVTVRFEQSAYEVDEGGSVVVAVTLSAAPEREVEIPLTGSPQGETDSGDFSGVPASLTFNADQTSRTFTFSATPDSIDDDGDSVLLGFGATLPDGVTAGSPDRATVSIIDDDDPPVTVRFEQSAYEVDEGGSVVVAVTLSAAPEREVEIPLTGSPQGETDSGDFSGVPASLTFNADQTSRTFTFSATPDSIDDDGDSVLLGFGATLPDGVTAGSPDRATVSIIDDDHPPVTVRFEQSAYEVDEGGSVVVAVTLSAAPEREVEIPLTGSPQGETDSGDFSGVPASLTFNADQTSRTFTFSATDDLLDDDGDSVLLTFGATLPDGVTAGSPDRATVSIIDDDHPPVTVRFEQSAYEVDEGGSVVVAVTLSAAPEREVEIPLTGSPQGETDSGDFSGVPASLTFNADQTSRTFTFSATDDLLDDDGDSVLLTFGATLPDGVTAGSPDRATVSIIDDDHPPVTVRFEQSAYEVDEGGSVVVAVTLSAAPEREVEIPLTGSPQGETDSGDFSGVPASLTFNADQTSRTFTFSATDDLLDDDGDSVLLGFGSTLPDGVTAGSPDQATVSITDDDRPDSLTVRFQTANYSIIEGDSRTITVLLDDDPERSVVIPIRAEHEGGANPSDYSDLPASLTFNSGQTSRSFQLRAVEDQLIESGEQLRLRFDQLPPDVSAGDPAVALATLHDRTQGQNLPSPPTIHFAQASYTVAEGATLQITVTLSKAPGSEVEITLTGSPQGETTAADFSIPTSLTFGPAETSKTLTFAATPDSIDDDGDSVLLSFSNLPAGITTTPGSPDQATVSIIDDDHPPVTVRFEQSAYEVDEGGSVVVAVTLSAAPEREVEIPLTGSPQGETDSGDFSGVPASLTFNADQTSRTFTFSATDDLLDDDGDSVLLTFGATLPDGVTAGSPDRATVSIIDDDHPPVTVRFEQSAYEVDEGGSVVVAVTLSAAPEREVEIPLTGSPQGETDSGDFSGVPASLTFNADQTSRTFTFSATPDSIDDDGDSVLLGFGATLPDGVTAGSPDRATVSIIDDDDPPVTVRFEQSAYEVDEGGSVVVAVTLSAAPEREVEIPLTGSPQGETDSGDFSGVPASLTFNADQTSRTFTFSATDDLLDDDGDSVLLTFGATLPDGVTAGSPDRATVSIIDDDHPPVTVRFEQSAYEVDEGGSVVVAVTLSAAPEREVEIPLTGSPQGETDSGDFSGVPASLTFNADQTSRTFTFSATDDLLDDDGDSVLLGFGSTLPDGVTAGSPDQATVSITDDDRPDSLTVRFQTANYSIIEGDSRTITVLLDDDPERSVVIPIRAEHEGGANPSDYSDLPASLTFNSGQTSRSFQLRAVEDQLIESGEQLRLRFDQLPPDVSAGDPAVALATLHDRTQGQNLPSPPTIHFAQASYTVAEGATLQITVTLSKAPGSEVEITLTGSPQGETTAADFSIPTSLTFGPAETSKTLTFAATPDSIDDDGDSVLLSFSNLPAGITTTPGSPDQATVSIIDDDHPPVTVRFEQSAYEVDEGGSVVVAVTLSAAPEREVEIPLTGSPQGETDSGDFSGVPASLTFNADQTSRTFTFSATPDSIDDDGDSVLLGFGATLPDGVTAGSPDRATVSIIDDDHPPVTVRFEQSAYEVDEGGSVVVAVTLSAAPEREVEIPLTGSPQGETDSGDFSGVPASLTFNADQTSRTFTFSATDDLLDDDGDSVLLGFGATLPDGVTAGSPDRATVSIIDDDHPPVTVRFEQSAYEVDEGGSVVVAVTLSAAPEREVEIPLTGSPQGETDSGDFSGVPASLTFNADQTSRTFTFSATDDLLDDDGDSVLLTFGATLPDGVTAGSPDRATVSIIDDDHPPVTVRFEQSAYEVDEGGSVVVAVTLSAAPEREVEIPLTGSPQGETDSGDFSGVPASLTFNADQTSRTFTFSATDDLLDDDGDSVLLGFGSTLPDGVTAGSPDQATISITDDDRPVTVRFEQSAYEVDEGGSVVVAVTLSAAPEREVEIPLTGSPQGETDSGDFSGVPASLTFNADQTSRTFTFSANDDLLDDDGDSVLLTFGATLPDGVTAGSPDQATVSIIDDDHPPVTVSFATSVYQVPEGGSVAVTVILSEDPERSVAIPLTTTHLGSAGLEDYSGVPANLTFHSGETTRSFNVSAHEDDVNDEGESIRLGFEMLPSGVSEGPTSSTTIAITQPAVWVDGTLRLVNGETFTADGRPCDGRLEIFIDGSWGTICDDYWTKENADVACRALGFAAGSVDNVLRFSSARFGRGSGDIVLDDVSCSGDEFGMLDCPRRGNIAVGTHNCRHSEDVGVRCLKEAPPRVVNIEVSEPPGDNGRYDAGETVEITLIWNVPVKVTTPQGGLEPKVWIVFDDGMQTLATYSRGSGTYRTVFVHRLTYLNRDGLPNESYETVRVVADTLQERGGSIRSVGLGLPPVLQHLGYPEIRDTAAPATIVTPPQFNDAGADATWSVGDTIEVTFNFNFPVVVDTADGTPFATILLGGDTLRQSTYLRGSGTNQLVFAYALTESDGTHDVLIVQPNVLMLNGGTIRDQIFNLDASLVHWHAAQIASAQTVGPGSTSAPLTASIENDPGSHDGSSAFTFELHFSEEVQLSSATLRNAAFSVSGGQVTNAQPQSEASTRWTVTVQPTGNESVTIALPATTDCTSAGAVCTSDGRPLVAPVQLVVPRSFALQFFQANSPATGAPEIVGTPQVEQTLTAQTTGITDDDGMEDATIAYQWMRHNPDSLSDEEISGATVVTYTVTAQDRGSALRVRTTFTDDAGNHESLTSLPTAMIPRLPLTATIVNASPTHDGHSVYTFELRLSEDLVSDFSFRTLRDYAFLVSGGDVTRARRLDRPGNMRWEISIQPDSDGELYITLPSTTDCAYLNALCTPDGRRQSSRLELIVPGPNGN